ncbi:hypothetical protein [Streptomyces gilvifuscus]|uniref:Uncharacterized protein n=1 Tax=Streptomyces gilvifuscus TaxID=1550617 RepID=A0ABT5G3A5_9ACTN|nr:hypothetical protein [Streptomyces gilvifuscus]MDC2959284.1 hypothetical protein [Streptomyces gilvifuscus]
MATASVGSGVLHLNKRFDLESGIEVSGMGLADVWWRLESSGKRDLEPLLGAGLCALGPVPYDPLDFEDLISLTYGSTAVPGGPAAPNSLVHGDVLAVRTRSGKFVKVIVDNNGPDLDIRWRACTPPVSHRDVHVVLGSAPEWLVTRYVVDCAYDSPDGQTHACGNGTFGPSGGTVQGQLSDEGGGFPATVRVVVVVDFQPDTGLPGLVKQLTADVTETGASLLFEPNQIVQRVPVVIDLHPAPRPQDYLLLRWKFRAGDAETSAGQHTLSAPDLTQHTLIQYEIAALPDPVHTMSLQLGVDGQYQGVQLVPFAQQFPLPVSAVALRFQKAGSGPAYRLIAF